MNERTKNIFSLIVALVIVSFLFFAIMHWIFGWNIKRALEVAIPGATAGFVAPYVVNYFRKRIKNKI
ncbi:MAG TPA: hypothetical protein VET23_11975 [Chitinophagaceae bacterium]|nr:hypothetical protein [Chitinophagaceae bacterium]